MILDVSCYTYRHILRIAGILFTTLQWVIPIFLIVLITFDLAKIVINGDEKQKKDSIDKAVKRFLYAIIIFFIPLLVKFAFRTIGDLKVTDRNGGNINTMSWYDCFNEYFS